MRQGFALWRKFMRIYTLHTTSSNQANSVNEILDYQAKKSQAKEYHSSQILYHSNDKLIYKLWQHWCKFTHEQQQNKLRTE
jgi:hypothetical protein